RSSTAFFRRFRFRLKGAGDGLGLGTPEGAILPHVVDLGLVGDPHFALGYRNRAGVALSRLEAGRNLVVSDDPAADDGVGSRLGGQTNAEVTWQLLLETGLDFTFDERLRRIVLERHNRD